MTLVLTAWTPFGGVMAADERITFVGAGRLPPPREGCRKIIPWDEMNAAVGFAGVACGPDGKWTDEFLEALMRSREWADLDEFARALVQELSAVLPRGVSDLRAALKVSVTGYGRKPSPDSEPCFWHVRNTEWNRLWPAGFRADEDLRDAVSAGSANGFQSWATRWIGRHDAYARRAEKSLSLEGARAPTLEEAATWASREIIRVRPEIARMIMEERGAAGREGRAPAPWAKERTMNVGPSSRSIIITRSGVRSGPAVRPEDGRSRDTR